MKKIFQSVVAGQGRAGVWWWAVWRAASVRPGQISWAAEYTLRLSVCLSDRMAANSEAEFRMMFLLNNMDINQEGQLSSEDRLFSSGTPRYQSENSQVNKNLFNTFDIKLWLYYYFLSRSIHLALFDGREGDQSILLKYSYINELFKHITKLNISDSSNKLYSTGPTSTSRLFTMQQQQQQQLLQEQQQQFMFQQQI